jgi:tetratricopeptide (TPR) repeat protein
LRRGASGKIDNPEALKLLEASIYTEMNRFEDAVSIYEWLLGSDPKNIRYLLMLGQTYNRAKEYDKAEKTFLRIKDVDPDNIDYLIQLSIVYDFSGQFKKAEKSLLDVLKKQPDNSLALIISPICTSSMTPTCPKPSTWSRCALSANRATAPITTQRWGYLQKRRL